MIKQNKIYIRKSNSDCPTCEIDCQKTKTKNKTEFKDSKKGTF